MILIVTAFVPQSKMFIITMMYECHNNHNCIIIALNNSVIDKKVGLFIQQLCTVNPLTLISQFFGIAFHAPKTHKPKNWLYDACLDKTFPSSRNASPIIIQLPLVMCNISTLISILRYFALTVLY